MTKQEEDTLVEEVRKAVYECAVLPSEKAYAAVDAASAACDKAGRPDLYQRGWEIAARGR